MKIPSNELRATVGLLALVAALVAIPAAADQVILDDLIVDGSLCVGFDCVNGESFGFDTIRMKENNLRIKALDTSTAASFPTQDWQLTFNDSANGGANKFAVECVSPSSSTPFTVEGCAPSHSLYVDDGGRIGLGTNIPSVELHIKDGDTPTLRLEQDSSSGFTPQTWDVAGNETNFFIRDVTNGSALPLRIRPGAASNSIFVDVDDDIGFGTSSLDAAADLHLRRTDADITRLFIENANAATQITGVKMTNATTSFNFEISGGGNFVITEQGSGGPEFTIDHNATGNAAKFLFQDGGTDLMEIEADGDVQNATGVFAIFSDRNKKREIQPVDAAEVLARVSELPISTWRYATQDVRHMGPMAQDFYAAFGLYEGDTSVALNDLAGVALAAIQGLSRELEAKDAAIRLLTERVAALEAAKAATP